MHENHTLYICDLHFNSNDVNKTQKRCVLRKNATPIMRFVLICLVIFGLYFIKFTHEWIYFHIFWIAVSNRPRFSNENENPSFEPETSNTGEPEQQISTADEPETSTTSEPEPEKSTADESAALNLNPDLNSICTDQDIEHQPPMILLSWQEYNTLMQLIPKLEKLKNTVNKMEKIIEKKCAEIKALQKTDRNCDALSTTHLSTVSELVVLIYINFIFLNVSFFQI